MEFIGPRLSAALAGMAKVAVSTNFGRHMTALLQTLVTRIPREARHPCNHSAPALQRELLARR